MNLSMVGTILCGAHVVAVLVRIIISLYELMALADACVYIYIYIYTHMPRGISELSYLYLPYPQRVTTIWATAEPIEHNPIND